LLAAGIVAATAGGATAATEHRVAEWPRMSLGLAGANVVYAVSTDARIRPGGYIIHRTDSFVLPIRGEALTGTRRAGIVLRTSAGATTAGALAGGPAGRHLLIATGLGFPPQAIFCCRSTQRDFPVEASGRVDAPVTLAGAVAWPLVRIVTVAPTGEASLITRTVAEAPGLPFADRLVAPLDARPLAGLVALSAGRVAWVDERTPSEVRVAAIPAGGSTAGPPTTVPQSGEVVRLHVTDQTLVTLVHDDRGYEVVRHDPPDLRPTVVWTGPTPPGPTAAGGITVALIDGTRVLQNTPGDTTRTALHLRGRGSAIAVDDRRVAVIERIRVRGRSKLIKRSAIRIAPVAPGNGTVAP
jgi:hypothetical protein